MLLGSGNLDSQNHGRGCRAFSSLDESQLIHADCISYRVHSNPDANSQADRAAIFAANIWIGLELRRFSPRALKAQTSTTPCEVKYAGAPPSPIVLVIQLTQLSDRSRRVEKTGSERFRLFGYSEIQHVFVSGLPLVVPAWRASRGSLIRSRQVCERIEAL